MIINNNNNHVLKSENPILTCDVVVQELCKQVVDFFLRQIDLNLSEASEETYIAAFLCVCVCVCVSV